MWALTPGSPTSGIRSRYLQPIGRGSSPLRETMAPPDIASGATNGSAPAGYGRSCTNCSRAKCRCILRPGGDVCERCHRLGKECHQMISQRKRAVKKASSSRTAQLEEKLDDLVSILRASQQHQSPSSHPNGHPDPTRVSSQSHHGAPYPHAPGQHQASMPSALDSLATAATASRQHPDQGSAAYNPMTNETDHLPEPTPAEAEVYLSKFKGWLRNFPLLHIEPSMTAAQLREEKPFAWLTIMCITTMSVAQQCTIKERVRRELAQKIIIDHEPSLDILQGLLIFLGFSACNAGPGPRNKPYAILFPKLAVSTACELGLIRSPTEEQYFANCFKPWIGRPPFKVRTMEERRSLLSLWFITSVFASFIGKIEPLRWMSHMDECLEVLDREKAVPYDEILVAYVKLQIIGEEAHKYMVTDAMGGNSGQAPTFLYRKSLINRLKNLRDELSSVISANSQLQAFLYGVEVQVYSVGLGTHGISDPARVDIMYACLTSARAWYDIFFSMPAIEVPGVPFGFFIQLSQTQTALYRLTISDDPAWDKSVLRNTADILDLLSRCITRFEEVDHAYPQKPGGDGEETLFTKAVKIMKMLRANWEPALTQSLWGGMPTPRSLPHSTSGHGGPGGPGTVSSMAASAGSAGSAMEAQAATMVVDPNPTLTEPGPVDFNDITWMTDVFGPWEF